MTPVINFSSFFSRLVHIKQQLLCDVYLKPRKGVYNAAVNAVVKDLMEMDPKIYKDKIKDWVLTGRSPKLLDDIELAVRQHRKKMMRLLQVGYSDSTSAEPNLEVFDKSLDKSLLLYECDKRQVKSEDKMFDAIDSFVRDAANDVKVTSVILITGKSQIQEDTDQLKLQFGETSCLADKFLTRYENDGQLHLVFCCYNNNSNDEKVWFSNARRRIPRDAKMLLLLNACDKIIKDE